MLRTLYETVLVVGLCAVLLVFAPLVLRDAPPPATATDTAWQAWDARHGLP
jgi:hypothetical protein